jgi:glycosyltransferase involved in cell wall biosynthesis
MTGAMSGAKIPVSVVVMTLNEAVNLPHCLAGLGDFAEVFVVDSPGSDGTRDIAAAWGARVVPFVWNGRLPKKKQWCLDNLPFACDWALFVDADEIVTPELAGEIARLSADGAWGGLAGCYIDALPVFMGRILRHGWGNRKLALFDRRRTRFPDVDDLDVAGMWEVEGHFQPAVDGPTGRLRAAMLHDDRKPLSAWFIRHARYAEWEAKLGADGRLDRLDAAEPTLRRWAKRLYRRLPLRPLSVFVIAYALRGGFLDGAAGFSHAVARAFYCWQAAAMRRDLTMRDGGR